MVTKWVMADLKKLIYYYVRNIKQVFPVALNKIEYLRIKSFCFA